MFTQPWWYVVQAETLRPQYCSNYELACTVAENLKDRYKVHPFCFHYENDNLLFVNNANPAVRKRKLINLDPRLANIPWRHEVCLEDEVIVSFTDVTNIRSDVVYYYDRAKTEKLYNNFYKIHTRYGSLCLTSNQMENLIKILTRI